MVMKSADTSRWRSHLINCSDTPLDVKRKISNQRPASIAFVESGNILEERTTTGTQFTSGEQSVISSNTILKWMDKLNTEENNILDEMFASVFYQTGIPFRFADSKSLKQFITRLRPAELGVYMISS